MLQVPSRDRGAHRDVRQATEERSCTTRRWSGYAVACRSALALGGQTTWGAVFMKKGPFQWRTSVTVRAPKQRVWGIVNDISLIPQYHPEVRHVDLLSGQRARAVGVRYQCTIPEGRKGSCIEEVVEYVPGERTATAFPEDTWGMSKMFADFVVETILVPQGEDETVLVLEAYYEPIGWKTRLLNVLFLRRLMARRALRTIDGIKRLAEVA
jgi:Polyketide cyclase / dehydrase and lipid transport